MVASSSSFPLLAREFAPYVNQIAFISQNGSVIHHGRSFVTVYPIQVTALGDTRPRPLLRAGRHQTISNLKANAFLCRSKNGEIQF